MIGEEENKTLADGASGTQDTYPEISLRWLHSSFIIYVPHFLGVGAGIAIEVILSRQTSLLFQSGNELGKMKSLIRLIQVILMPETRKKLTMSHDNLKATDLAPMLSDTGRTSVECFQGKLRINAPTFSRKTRSR